MLSEQEKRKANKQLECAVNGAHELFLREMHPLFNLRSPPKKIPVKIKPFLDDAAYLSKTIGTEEFQIGIRKSLQYAHDAFSLGKEFKFDSWKEYLATREYLAAHETAHYLRVIANPIAFSVSKQDEWWYPDRSFHLGHFQEEVIAEMAAIEFMRRLGRLSRIGYWIEASGKYCRLARKLLQDHGTGIISELVSQDAQQAKPLLLKYTPLIKQESLLMPEIAQGMFVHEEIA